MTQSTQEALPVVGWKFVAHCEHTLFVLQVWQFVILQEIQVLLRRLKPVLQTPQTLLPEQAWQLLIGHENGTQVPFTRL
jgi:hypothetical protein